MNTHPSNLSAGKVRHAVPLGFWIIILLLVSGASHAFGEAAAIDKRAMDYYVATTGDDNHSGTRDAPFATLTRARDAIRQLKKDGRFDAPVTVTVRGGTYFLEEPIVLGSEDSGTPDKPVTYQAAIGETVILSGGVPIEGPWNPISLNGTPAFVTEVNGTADRRVKQIIRIDDSARVAVEGVWSRKDRYLHDQAFKKSLKSVTFSPDLPEDGRYDVYLRWTQRDDAARKVPVDVRFKGGTQRYIISQATRGGWYRLGTHDFAADSDRAVIVRNNDTEGLVMAEAVMFIKAESPSPWVFRQLIENDEMQIRARYPNTGHLYATGGGVDHLTMRPAELKASWGEEPDAQVHLVAGAKFFNQLPTIASVDPMSGTVNIEDECFTGIRNNNSFHVEGIRSELDAPGEWYLDSAAGRLYFKPKNSTPGRVIAPRLNSIFRLMGDAEKGTYAEHIGIRGFSIRHTGYTLGHLEPRVNTDGAVILENARNCTIAGNEFQHLGGYAIWLRLDSRENRIERNSAKELGAGFVLATGALLSYMEPHLVLDHRPQAATLYPVNNTIAGNTARGLGRIRYYNAGVHLDSRPENLLMEIGNRISNNTFSDLSRNGIFAFRNQGGNVIEFNHIHDFLKETIDGAGIHIASMSKLNAPNWILNNHIHDGHGISRNHGQPARRTYAYGVYLDWYSSYSTVADNVIRDCSGGHGDSATRVFMGGVHNELTNNLPEGDTQKAGAGVDVSNRISTAGRTHVGCVVDCFDRDRVSLEGKWQTVSKPGFGNLLNYFYKQSAAEADAGTKAVFELPVPQDGNYDVFVFTIGDSGQATKAPVEIIHADGTTRTTLDLSQDNVWVLIGNHRFRKDSGTIVFAADGADGRVVAHKIGLIRTGSPR